VLATKVQRSPSPWLYPFMDLQYSVSTVIGSPCLHLPDLNIKQSDVSNGDNAYSCLSELLFTTIIVRQIRKHALLVMTRGGNVNM
jgi:hypothetical protein